MSVQIKQLWSQGKLYQYGRDVWFVLQEGTECVVHRGQVQVLRMAVLWLHLWLLAGVALCALTRARLLPPDRVSRAALETFQNHVGKLLLEPLEVLPEKAGTRVQTCLKFPVSYSLSRTADTCLSSVCASWNITFNNLITKTNNLI